MTLGRDYASYAVLVVQGITFLVVPDMLIAHVIQVALFAVELVLYRHELKAVVTKGILFIKNR